MDDTQWLISGYLDEELTDEENDRLVALLQTDSDAVTRFAVNSFVHSHLNEWMDQRRVQDDAIGGVVPAADAAYDRSPYSDSQLSIEQLLCDCPELDEDLEPVTGFRRFLPRSMAARAAALFVAATVALAGYAIATRPVAVAQLTQATGCQWEASQSTPQVGALLKNGQSLQLVKGQALITLVSGAQVLTGGASFSTLGFRQQSPSGTRSDRRQSATASQRIHRLHFTWRIHRLGHDVYAEARREQSVRSIRIRGASGSEG